MSSLKARNISGHGVIAGRPAQGRYLHGHADLPDVGTNVSGGIDEWGNLDLPLKVAQRDDFVICSSQDAISSRQDLTIQNSRLALGSDDAVRSGQEERLESVEKGPPIVHVLDSGESDGCIVSCGVYRFQSLARLLFC